MTIAFDEMAAQAEPGLNEAPAPWLAALPATGADLSSPAPARATTLPTAPLRVLVVEGDAARFRWTQALLAEAGPGLLEAEWAVGVEAALRRLGGGGIDACLVTFALPGRDGLELARLAEARGFELPLILLGDRVHGRIDLEGLDLGIADYLEWSDLTALRLERALRFAVARKRRLDRVDRLAQFDELTGLANRALYQDRLDRALAGARRHGSHVAVMVLDLNGFKAVNDRLGHAAGDRLLQVVGDRIAGKLRQTDTVARLGGDEFALCLEHLARPEDATLVAQKLLDAIQQPVEIDGRGAVVTASLGVALYPGDATDPARLLRQADAAMYLAKAEGGNRCHCHDSRLDQRMRQGARAYGELRRAIDERTLALHFQPQVALVPGELGLAATVHWRHAELGLVEAAEVRRLAEDTGLIEPLTEWLVEAALARARDWQRAGFAGVHVAVPILSRRQLAWSGLGERIGRILGEARLAPGSLELEIAEPLLLQELAAGSTTLTGLAGQGVRLAVDGFGGGQSALALLRDLPLHTVKLARGLLAGTPDDPRRALLLVAVTRLARDLGLRVVAEGVESHEQLQLLRREGCHAVQAPMSCPPLPAAACLDWLRQATEGGRAAAARPACTRS